MENNSFRLSEASPEDITRLARDYAAQGRILNLLLDIVFKTVFSGGSDDSQNALRSLLSACTHRGVCGVQVANPEIYPEYLAGKTIRMDINVTFNDGEAADIEMQMGPGDDDLRARAAFYASRLLSGQGHRGEHYGELKRVYQIFFLNAVLWPGSPLVPRRYTLLEETEYDQLNDLVEIIFYEMPKLEEKVGRVLEGVEGVENLSLEEKWCIYLKYHQDEGKVPLIKELCREEAGIMSAEKVLNKVSAEYAEWARALSRELGEMDYRSGMNAAYRRGVKEGEAAVQEAEARVQAAEAQVQAVEQRVKSQKEAAIRKMREMGVTEDVIAASFPDGGGAKV
jgi:predicted transposase/invertase (TIGR01784 family)